MSVQVKCRLLRETDRALLLQQLGDNGAGIECWIARSQCDHISKGALAPDGSRDATVTMPQWLADRHKLETED